MTHFFSPVDISDSWTYDIGTVTVPAGLRYAGYPVRALHVANASAKPVRAAARGNWKRIDTATQIFVQLQVNPLFVRRIVPRLEGNLPTFYYVFPTGSPPAAIADDAAANGNDLLHTTTDFFFAIVSQDRITRDPAYDAARISAAIQAGGGNNNTWQPFASALAARFIINQPNSPVLILDHRGFPVTNGNFTINTGASNFQVSMTPADGGDLQETVKRLNPGTSPDSNLFGVANSFTLSPVAASGTTFDFQCVRLEDRQVGTNTITVTPSQRHIMFTNLHDWFASQCANPDVTTADQLRRYWHRNKVTPLVNGPEYFEDLFRELDVLAAMPSSATNPSGFHLAGWAMVVDKALRTPGDPALKRTLEGIIEQIGGAGHKARFLPSQFYQLQSSAGTTLTDVEVLTFITIGFALLTLNTFKAPLGKMDGSGTVLLLLLAIGAGIATKIVVDQNGRPLEQNKSAVDNLGAIANAVSRFAPYPARVEDQFPAPDLTGFPFTTAFQIIRHFGVHHQKLAIVKNSNGFIGYCGGIDLNTDRLDDEKHLNAAPFHDVHSRIEGPAVRDLALTFEQRWERDGGGAGLAFTTPASVPDAGTDIVQVARTYFKPAASSRALTFAPQGDRTIANSMIKAIESASEFIYIEDQYFTPPQVYQTALINKVGSGTIKKLIVVLPGVNDQPFGDMVRLPFISQLKQADPTGNVVHVGFPRRHFTVPNNSLRASSGKCILMSPLINNTGIENSIVLGPKSRLPVPPFWLAVDGELIYIFDESFQASPPDDSTERTFRGLRGDANRLMTKAKGATTRAHPSGTAATVIHMDGIYVHAKIMIIDDVFMTIGSANLNRRGLFHDGEANIFTMPEAFKGSPDNPVRRLRQKTWAEMLNLPANLAAPLLVDPLASADLFLRNPVGGNRFTDIEAQTIDPLLGSLTGGDSAVTTVLNAIGAGIIGANRQRIFDVAGDPTTSLETHNC